MQKKIIVVHLLFLLLFSYSQLNAQPQESKPTIDSVVERGVAVEAIAKQGPIEPEAIQPDTIKFPIVYFKFNALSIDSVEIEKVRRIADILQNHPQIYVELCGWSDSSGSQKVNRSVSERRAIELRYLLTKRGVAAKRIFVRGMGADSTETQADQARRVETIKIQHQPIGGQREQQTLLSDVSCQSKKACLYREDLNRFDIDSLSSYNSQNGRIGIEREKQEMKSTPMKKDSTIPTIYPEAHDDSPSKPHTTNRRVALKTNLLYLAALTINIEGEYCFNPKLSLNLEGQYAWWQNSQKHKCYRIASISPELRYWFHRKSMNQGHFAGVYVAAGTYEFMRKEQRGIQGKYFVSSGLSYGYMFPLSRRLNLELSIGFGYLTTEFRQYHYDDGCYVYDMTKRSNYIGVTKAKVSLVFPLGRGQMK